MTDPVAKAIAEIRKKHGSAIFADHARLKSDLPDHLYPLEDYTAELHLLQSAIDQGIVDEIQAYPQAALSKGDHGRLVQKLVDLAYDHDTADRIVAGIEEGLGKPPTHVPSSSTSAGTRTTILGPTPTPAPGPTCPRCHVGQMVSTGTTWQCDACGYSPSGSSSAASPPTPVTSPAATIPPGPVPAPISEPGRATISWIALGGAYGMTQGFLLSLILLLSAEGVAFSQLSVEGPTIFDLTLTGAFLGFVAASIVAAARGGRSYLQFWDLVAIPTIAGVLTGAIFWYLANGLGPAVVEGGLIGLIIGGVTGLLLALSPPLSVSIIAGALLGSIVTRFFGIPLLWVIGAVAGCIMGGVTMYVVSEANAHREFRAYAWCIVGCGLFGFLVSWILLPGKWFIGPILPIGVAVVAGGMTLLLDGVSPL